MTKAAPPRGPDEPLPPKDRGAGVGAGSPLDPGERVIALDALRGLAVLGILIVNAASFAMPLAWADEPLHYGPHTGLDLAAWSAIEVFAAGKFITLFSALFGAGVWLMVARADAAGRASGGTHYTRMAWLLLLGLIHAYLIWIGDVLVSYALVGMVLYPMCRLPTGVQGLLAGVFLAVGTLIALGWGGLFWLWEAMDPQDYAAFDPYPAADIEAELAAMRGGLLEQAAWRVPTAMLYQVVMIILIGPWTLGMMLLGVVLARTGVLTGARSARFYGWAVLVGLGVGLPVSAGEVAWRWAAEGDDYGGELVRMLLVFHWVAPAVGFAYAAGLILLIKAGLLRRLVAALAAVGRMALTNYLMQSLVMTLIFGGHGLGLFGRLGFAALVPVVVAVWLAQVGVSPLWLARFRFGPMEWLWRSLTYRRLQPLRRAG